MTPGGSARMRPMSARRRPSVPNLLDAIPEVRHSYCVHYLYCCMYISSTVYTDIVTHINTIFILNILADSTTKPSCEPQ